MAVPPLRRPCSILEHHPNSAGLAQSCLFLRLHPPRKIRFLSWSCFRITRFRVRQFVLLNALSVMDPSSFPRRAFHVLPLGLDSLTPDSGLSFPTTCGLKFFFHPFPQRACMNPPFSFSRMLPIWTVKVSLGAPDSLDSFPLLFLFSFFPLLFDSILGYRRTPLTT